MALATGITLADANPILGCDIWATLKIDYLTPYEISETMWAYTINYDGYSTDPIVVPSLDDSNVTIYATIPGDYLIQAVTTYTSTDPTAPAHAPTIFTAVAHVSPPIAASPNGGFGTPIPLHTATVVSSNISSANGLIGPYASGWMQERIPIYFDFNGAAHSWLPVWGPPTGIDTFDLISGVLYDRVYLGGEMIGGNGVDWSTIPDGSTVVAYVQSLRYAWGMTVRLPDGSAPTMMFTSELNTLSWEWVKVSWTTCMFRLAQP